MKVKLKILNSCIKSSILYGCESWSYASLSPPDVIHRSAIKTVLGIRRNVSNEIVYIESDTYPLSCDITYLQLKFWLRMKSYMENNPDSYISKLVQIGLDENIKFLKHYSNLYSKYPSPEMCRSDLIQSFITRIRNKIRSISDLNSPLGTYLQINPEFCSPNLDVFKLESDRILVSRYRCGSHYLEF